MVKKICEQSISFKDYMFEKKWVLVAMVVATFVLLGGFFGFGVACSPQIFNFKSGAMIACGVGAFAIGMLSIPLFVNKGRSPLHRAINNKAPIDLTKYTKYLNKPDFNGNRPLHYAVLYGHGLDTLLANKEVDLSAKNHEGHSPLELALKRGNQNAVTKLLVNTSSEVSIDASLVVSAVEEKIPDGIVESLLAKVTIEGHVSNILFAATENGKLKDVKTLLAKYSFMDHELRNAFWNAAFFHRKGTVCDNVYEKILDELIKKVDVNARISANGTALHIAANVNDESLVDFLIKKGIDVTIQDQNGMTAARIAMQDPSVEAAIALIKSEKLSKEDLDRVEEVAKKYTGSSRSHIRSAGHKILQALRDLNRIS